MGVTLRFSDKRAERARSRLSDGGSSSHAEHPVEMLKHFGPCLLVPVLRLFVWKAFVGKPQMCSLPTRCELDGYDRLSALGSGGGHPCHLDDPIGPEPEESSVVWVALAFVMRLEEERRVNPGLHQNRARHR